MSATLSSGRPTGLVVHDDGEALDFLVRLFEAANFDVITAVSAFRAQTQLEGERRVDVVVAPWDSDHGVGGEVYRWALQKRYDLRDQFVFIGTDPPEEFDLIVGGRCLVVSLSRAAEIVRVALAAIKRRVHLEASRDVAFSFHSFKPRLLLADDDPMMLAVMGDLLADIYSVTRVDSGNAAINLLANQDFEVIVTDWQMDDGSGGDVYRWIEDTKPELAHRVVILTSNDGEDAQANAPGRPVFRKGQDSAALTAVLTEIVRQVRGESNPALEPPAV
ncbi:MAG TPA: response regulator [Kofleriaceae bacterium]|jgi:CheY-like chemotaxis protein